jgi:hypothetical protein
MALSYAYISTATTTSVKVGSGILHKIVVGSPVASSTIGLVDNTSGTTVNLGLITNTTDVKPYVIELNARFSTGLRIVTSSTDKITVVYQ